MSTFGADMLDRVWGLLRSRRGATAVEFALMVPVLSALFIGLASYGLATTRKMELESAARAGAQYALLDATNTSNIQQAVVDSTNAGITTSDVSVVQSCKCADGTAITCGNTCTDGSSNQTYMTVTATENYSLLLISTTITLTGSAVVRTD